MNEKPNAPATTGDIAVAIEAGMALAEPHSNPHPHGEAYAIVPANAALVYLAKPVAPPHRSGTVKLDDDASFLEYWKRQFDPTSYIYGSLQPAQFVAVFNEHSRDAANWRNHRAVLTLNHSKEWEVWNGRNRQPFDGNEAFAIWLEDNLVDIVAPEPGKFMDIALNFRVKQGQVFGKAIRLQDGNIDLAYANAVEGGAPNETGKLTMPEMFTINIPVWQGLESLPYRVDARFRFRLQAGALQIRYELVRPHKVVEQAFKDCLNKIESAAGTTVLFGTPE